MPFEDYNFAGLKSRLHFRLQNHPKYTEAMRGLALNKASEALALEFKNIELVYETDTFVLDSGTYAGQYAMEYPLPPYVLYLESVSFDGHPLDPMTQKELVETRVEQSVVTGPPTRYYVRDDGSQKVLTVFSRPNSEKKLQIYGVFAPTAMVEDDSAPPWRDVFSTPMEFWGAWYLLDGQEGMEQKALLMKAEYKDTMATARNQHGADRVMKIQRSRR